MTDAFGDTGRHRGSDLAVADGDVPRFPSLWPAFYSPWQVFSEFLPRQWRGGPSVEVSEEGDDLVVRVEAPGVKPEDLNVWITEDSVTVEGERRSQRRSEHRGYYHSERQYGAFRRTIPLPVRVNADLAEARYQHGVLEVRAPKHSPHESRHGRRLPVH